MRAISIRFPPLLLVIAYFGQATAQSYGTSGPTKDDLVVDLDYAKYRGVANDTFKVNTWHNIHYAQPPTGDLRWRAPQPIELNSTYTSGQILDAAAEGPSCVQGWPAWTEGLFIPTLPDQPAGDEDCLLLNVYTPAAPASSKLPVVVLIHGGGYTLGDANNFQGPGTQGYNSVPLVNHSDGTMIAVSIQHRLGTFGFLGSDEVQADGTANAGLLDQRLALDWIQKHVAAFGGDPEQVTIYGASAGGGAVVAQMILHGGAESPPFKAAIAEYPWLQTYHDTPVLSTQYQQLLNAVNCTDLACLRNLDSESLIRGTQQSYVDGYAAKSYAFGDFYFGPTLDGKIIPSLPSDAFVAGAFTKGIPLLTDRDGYEGVLFTNTSTSAIDMVTANFQTWWPTANHTFFDELYQFYPPSAFNSTFFQSAAIFGDALLACPTHTTAKAVSDGGADAYKMVFEAGTELHGATAAFIFDDPSAGNMTIGQWLEDYIVAFTVHEDPNAIGGTLSVNKPVFPKYVDQESILVVNQTTAGSDVDGNWDDTARCAFWDKWAHVVRN